MVFLLCFKTIVGTNYCATSDQWVTSAHLLRFLNAGVARRRLMRMRSMRMGSMLVLSASTVTTSVCDSVLQLLMPGTDALTHHL